MAHFCEHMLFGKGIVKNPIEGLQIDKIYECLHFINSVNGEGDGKPCEAPSPLAIKEFLKWLTSPRRTYPCPRQ